ncbi:hypothetical protein [Pseudomonas sp. NC02]|jgi:hypothetical protein|uniref:hypothetical protein n=1 Tax=Pseudomonas sp. NC02 TaxID=2067572 RepID=UPI000C82A676|nr:hypothetical protein [Pseudomonas sp. NC02]AUO22874.1 hypothetical protein C0058_13125 [Pseudomonas sp. NC02]
MTNVEEIGKNDYIDGFGYPFSAVEKRQEQYYLGDSGATELLQRLDKLLPAILERPESTLEALFVLRMLKDIADVNIPETLLSIVFTSFDASELHEHGYGTYLWVEDPGRLLITEILDLVFEYRRPADMASIMNMLSWDLFHIPSHIFMLIRKHRWNELQNRINSRYDIQSEYDPMIRTQHFLTEEALKKEWSSEDELLSSTHKELIALRLGLSTVTKPVLYVEGKTDRMILNTAYSKLFPNEEIPFLIKECDVTGGNKGGSGGAQTLCTFISTVRKDSAYPALALFDNDREGMEAYKKLPKYFKDRGEGRYAKQGKLSESGRAGAMLIPASNDRRKYVEMQNYSIEFLFDDDVLGYKNDQGYGLVLRYPDLEVRVKNGSGLVVETRKSDILETREISDGKLVFARDIVPELDSSRFSRFSSLFWDVKDFLLSDMKTFSNE